MSGIHDATRRQQVAAHPTHSTWLSANAGSGKTRVLTDRVARLLLEGVQPQHILCLTYTKAAASEMQNRLFERLGAWSMLDDDKLSDALSELGLDRTPSGMDLRNARTLFARAIETPGGLKIQTIHSFCAALLRRFPLEAGVSPDFTEIEDRAADLLRAEVVDQMADGPDAPLFVDLARQYTGGDILKLTRQIVSNAGDFGEMSIKDALVLFGHAPSVSRTKIVADTFQPGDWEVIQELIPILIAKGGNDKTAGERMQKLSCLDFNALPTLTTAFVFGPATKNPLQPKIGSFPTKPTQKLASHLMPQLDALMQRVADAQDATLALAAAEHTLTLHRFSHAFTDRYQKAKQARGWLDFDDLIIKARHLLSDSRVADWVLYRLDGAIDHILVDEAQDTSPVQWDVILKLAEEFSSGIGAKENETRTIFVVGDKKQSIYSFQGADPREFNRIRSEIGSKLTIAGQKFQELTLDYSFRSSSAILNLLDSMFDGESSAGFSEGSEHIAFNIDLPGRVDLWPVVPKPDKEDDGEWFDPVDRPSPEHEHRVLAQAIAARIKQMIDDETVIPDGKGARPVQPKDFLILVQRRSGIFGDIIRACKENQLPIAGADRLKVGAEIAVRDLGALLSFLATPEDSLSLATVLRSPLFGWTEQQLFTLCHHREEDHLWQALRGKAEEYPETVPALRDLRANTDFLRPYDLIERVLTRHGGRNRLLARLGREAEDGINALLSQALSYERASIPSLTGFLTWMETDDLEIKRQIDSASNQIRVMTVHGAKGLEAPIVILPECGKRDFRMASDIISVQDTPVWRMPSNPSNRQPKVMQSSVERIKEAQREESLRLLYVALTRAKNWLIVAATGELSKAGTDWWQQVEAGMRKGETTDLDTPVGVGLRKQHGDWEFSAATDFDKPQLKGASLPDLFQRMASEPAEAPSTLSPSDLGGAKALPGEGLDEETAKAYGTLVHALLERLPTLDRAQWAEASPVIAQSAALSAELRLSAASEVAALLADTALASVFHKTDALAEVAITANFGARRVHGTIDRLILTEDAVQIVDFKTNRVVPNDAQSCPDGLLRQMGAYALAMKEVYPDRQILLDILWTRTGKLMRLPHDVVSEALSRSQYLDDVGTGS